MSLTKEEVEHIAELARLELTEEEKTRYREQLSANLNRTGKTQRAASGHPCERAVDGRSIEQCAVHGPETVSRSTCTGGVSHADSRRFFSRGNAGCSPPGRCFQPRADPGCSGAGRTAGTPAACLYYPF